MRYVVGEKQTKRVDAGEPYGEEWFDIKTRADTGAVLAAAEGASNSERTMRLITALISDWSLLDKQGAKAPVTLETFQGLPIEMTAPLLDEVQRPDFLASLQRVKSALPNPSS
jgi:hypothetical protein